MPPPPPEQRFVADPETDVESVGAITDVESVGARTDVESGGGSEGGASIVGEGARTDVEDPESGGGTDVGF